MKKALLLLLGIMSFTSVIANDINTKTTINTRSDDAVTFIEKGVQFHIFLNGDFEFNTQARNRDYYNDRRYNQNNVRIDRDYKGRIRRIGSNYIRYDYKGNVTRIGNVRIYYNRGLLRRVGDLKVSYNSWGDPYFYGNVHRNYYDSDIYFSLNLGSIFNYNDRYFYNHNFKNNYRKYREDKYYYYYKVRPNGKVGKRGKIIKRRKAGVKPRKNYNNNKRKVYSNRGKSGVNTRRNNYNTTKRKAVPKKVVKRRKTTTSKKTTPYKRTKIKKETIRRSSTKRNEKRRG